MNNLPNIPLVYVDRLIAEGGTAKVYWGVDRRSGYPVAIKELKVKHFKNPAIRQKFKEMEPELYAYLEHPNIPKLVDFIDIKEREQMFIVMEYIEGKNLEQYIYQEIGLIPEERALPMFIQVLDTVDYIHWKGYLHLDLKSNNVMILPDGKIKLIDLGIASRIKEASSDSSGFGTPAYMPPEQSDKGHCGRYTDVFALGVMLFEMLTGTLPFTSQNPDHRQAVNEIQQKIKYAPTPQMKRFYPHIGDGLQPIVEKAMAKNPSQRFQTCGEFKSALEKYMQKRGINNYY